MKMNQARYYAKKLQAHGHKASINEGYSGRAMYGATTIGLSVDNSYTSELTCPGLRNFRSDNLGKGKVYY